MTHTEQIDQLATALTKAQTSIKSALKGSENPFYKSTYADLAAVRDACIGPLTENGLAIIQAPSSSGDVVSVTTLLVHVSGQWVESTIGVHPKDEGPQALGSAITYLRRYALAAIAGVASVDDDGEAAEGRTGGRGGLVFTPPKNRPAPEDGALRVVRVLTAVTAKKNITRFKITLSDGRDVSTIQQRLGELCEQLAQDQSPVVVKTEPTKWGENLVEIHRAGESEAITANPVAVTAQDIPF